MPFKFPVACTAALWAWIVRAAQYRTIGTNGSTGGWRHMSVKEAEEAQKTGRWIDHPATVKNLCK